MKKILLLAAVLGLMPALARAQDAQPNIGAMMALLGGCTYGKAMASGQVEALTKKVADLEKELTDLKAKPSETAPAAKDGH